MKSIGKLKLYSSKEISDSFVSIGFECADRYMINPDKCYAPLAKTGIKHARCSSGWARCEKQPGVYDFEWLDSIVDNLLNIGVQPWFNLVYGNPIYMEDRTNEYASGCSPMNYGEDVLQRWLDYCRNLALHFKGRVICYEVWNEANSSWFWYPGKPDMKKYAELIRLTGNQIRSVDKNARIGANLDGRAFHSDEWIKQLFPSLNIGDIDFYCFHCYQLCPELNYFPGIARLRKLLDENGHTSVEIRNGEFGHPSYFENTMNDMKPKSQSNEHRQAVAILRRYFLDKSAGCALSSFFTIADDWEVEYELPHMGKSKMNAHGMLNGLTYTEKEAALAMSVCANIFSGNITPVSHTVPICEDKRDVERNEPVIFKYKKDNNPVCAYYLPTEIEDEVPPSENFSLELDVKFKNPIAIDTYTTEALLIDSPEEKDGKYIYKGLRLAEYPIVICESNTFDIV